MTKVNLLIAKNPKEKLQLIKTVSQKLFDEGKRFTILAPNEESLKFLNTYLWSEDLFIPHQIANRATDEFVLLTTTAANLNKSTACINLCQTVAPSLFEEIYDLLDHTSSDKIAQSNVKQSHYTSNCIVNT